MILQLDPWIKLETPLGAGWAVFYCDDGDEIWWTIFLRKTRAIVQFPNNKVRAHPSYTLDLGLDEKALRKKITKSA